MRRPVDSRRLAARSLATSPEAARQLACWLVPGPIATVMLLTAALKRSVKIGEFITLARHENSTLPAFPRVALEEVPAPPPGRSETQYHEVTSANFGSVVWAGPWKYLQWLVVFARFPAERTSCMVYRFAVLLLIALSAHVGCQRGESSGPGVVLLRYNPGSESTEQREKGFLETLAKEYPGINVISSNQYAGTTPELALDKATDVLNKYHDRVTGIFAVCEPNANGLLGALENTGLAGKVKSIVFDPSPALIKAMADDKVHGIVLQDPVTMGYLGVKTMVAHLEGNPVEKRIVTGEYVATPENMNDGPMRKLLEPAQYDGGEQPANVKYRIAVIPKGTTHEFWKSVHAGAAQAAKEAGNVEILWKGPLQENDTEGQINVVQEFITKKVDGLVLAPLDSQALVAPVKDAKLQGMPTVIFDSGLADESIVVSYAATDNYHGGALAAHRLAEVLGAQQEP
jgi:ABC-type sugar transport system substrate-binding protein